MVGLGAGGSSVLAPTVGGGSRSISDDSALLIVFAVPMFSGRDFFLVGPGRGDVGPGRGDDLELFFRDAIGVTEDCGFSELEYSEEAEWYLFGPAGTLGVGAASRSS